MMRTDFRGPGRSRGARTAALAPAVRRRALVLLVLFACLASGAEVASAKRGGAVVTELQVDGGTVTVDWTRGVLLTRSGASADLRAPSPAVARVGARRRAEALARRRLSEAGARLVAEAAEAAAPSARAGQLAKAALEEAVAAARIEEVRYASDGSVTLTAMLPIEALRIAAAGVPLLSGDLVSGRPSAVIVAAGPHLAAPRVGLRLVLDGTTLAGPVVYVSARPAAASEVVGDAPLELTAVEFRGGELLVSAVGAPAEALAALQVAVPIVIVILMQGASK